MLHPAPPSGANAPRSRSHNRQVILGQIQAGGPMGRAALARVTGLSTQAVSNIIADLETDGFLQPCGAQSRGRGLPAVQYRINPGGAFAFGIELRQTALLGALLDLAGEVQATHRIALRETTPDAILPLVKRLKRQLLAICPQAKRRLLGTGVVMPGPFGETGLSGASSDLQGWSCLNASDALGESLETGVIVQNDANAAAMAERFEGLGRASDNFAYLYFGAGLGLGIVSQGRLISGAFGNAGELGRIPVATPLGPRPLEELSSRNSAQAYLAARGLDGSDIDKLSAVFTDQRDALDPWLVDAAAGLSQIVPLLENLLDPETIVLGGAMPGPVLEALVDRLALPEKSVSNRTDRRCPRVQVGTCGRLTATRGAAALVLNQAMSPHFALSA